MASAKEEMHGVIAALEEDVGRIHGGDGVLAAITSAGFVMLGDRLDRIIDRLDKLPAASAPESSDD